MKSVSQSTESPGSEASLKIKIPCQEKRHSVTTALQGILLQSNLLLDNSLLTDKKSDLDDTRHRSSISSETQQLKPSVVNALQITFFPSCSALSTSSLSDIETIFLQERSQKDEDLAKKMSSLITECEALKMPFSCDSRTSRRRGKKPSKTSSVFDAVAPDGPQPTLHDMKHGKNHLLGEIHFTLTYNSQEKRLGLQLIEGVDLLACDINGKSDPYVMGTIIPQQVGTFKSNVISQNLNPVWNEHFLFEDITAEMMSTSSIYLVVLDEDLLSRDDIIGNVILPLCVVLDNVEGDAIVTKDFHKYIEPCPVKKSYRGKLLISLCYDKNEKRILLKIHKARALKGLWKSKPPSPYCDIVIKNVESKESEQRRTIIQEKTSAPQWDYVISYHVEDEAVLSNIRMKISVMTKDHVGKHRLGKLVLALLETNPQQSVMWGKMMSNPNEVVTEWNTLYD